MVSLNTFHGCSQSRYLVQVLNNLGYCPTETFSKKLHPPILHYQLIITYPNTLKTMNMYATPAIQGVINKPRGQIFVYFLPPHPCIHF